MHDTTTPLSVRGGRRIRAAAVGALVAFALPGGATAGSPIVAEDAGDVMIIGHESGLQITEGDSLTAFRLVLPDGAACPGDSRHDDYRVQTFLVPETTELSTMEFDSVHPIGDDHNLTMRTVGGSQFVHEATAQNSGAGEPGLITPLPPFDLKTWPAEALYPGRWKLGVACTQPSPRIVDRYWDAQIDIVEDTSVEPGQRRFTVVDEFVNDDFVPEDDSSFPLVQVLLIVLAIIAVVVFVAAGRLGRTKEPPDPSDVEADLPGEPRPDAQVSSTASSNPQHQPERPPS